MNRLIPLASTNPLMYQIDGRQVMLRKTSSSLHEIAKRSKIDLMDEHTGQSIGFVDRLRVQFMKGAHYLMGVVNTQSDLKSGFSLRYEADRNKNQLKVTRVEHVANTHAPRDPSCIISDSNTCGLVYQDSTDQPTISPVTPEVAAIPTNANEIQQVTPTLPTVSVSKEQELEVMDENQLLDSLLDRLNSDPDFKNRLLFAIQPTPEPKPEPNPETKIEPTPEIKPEPTPETKPNRVLVRKPTEVRSAPVQRSAKPIQQPFPSR